MQRPGKIWYLGLLGLVLLATTFGYLYLQPGGSGLNKFIRGVALLGYLTTFLSIVSSAYLRQLVRFFGRPFIQVHHVLTVTGLILITLHPLGAAIQSANLGVFLPSFTSVESFLRLGGRPAWILFAIASLAAVLRQVIGSWWRTIHVLNYVAFLLGTIHAVMVGTDLQGIAGRIAVGVLAIITIVTFIQKRRR